MVVYNQFKLGEKMKFEYYKLGNRWVLKTYKNAWCTRAVFFKDEEINKVKENIKVHGWEIREKIMEEA